MGKTKRHRERERMTDYGNITTITEHTETNPLQMEFQGTYSSGPWEGWTITTSKGFAIRILVSTHTDCCESPGHIVSEDDWTSFIGARVHEVTKTWHEAFDGQDYPEYFTRDVVGLDEGGAVFVHLDTHRGRLEFAVYNAHNGYYGHTAVVMVSDVDAETRSL